MEEAGLSVMAEEAEPWDAADENRLLTLVGKDKHWRRRLGFGPWQLIVFLHSSASNC